MPEAVRGSWMAFEDRPPENMDGKNEEKVLQEAELGSDTLGSNIKENIAASKTSGEPSVDEAKETPGAIEEVEVKPEISSAEAEKEKIEDILNNIGKRIIEEWRKYASTSIENDDIITQLSLEISSIKSPGVYSPILITFGAIRNRLALVEGGAEIQERLTIDTESNESLESIIEKYLCDLPKIGPDHRERLKLFLSKLGEALDNRLSEIKNAKDLSGVFT